MPERINPTDEQNEDVTPGEEDEDVKTPEQEESPERHIVGSFAELIVRGRETRKIRIWDMGIREGFNENAGKKYLEAVPEAGSYIDGTIYQPRSTELSFDVYGPDLNNPEGKRVAFWGGRINSKNIETEWANKIDLGKDDSGRNQDDYVKLFKEGSSRPR